MIDTPIYLYDIQGSSMILDSKDKVITPWLIREGVWESDETKLLKTNLKKGDIFVDIGAHIGYYTLIASKIVGTTGQVYAFEPEPRNFEILMKNVERNDCRNVVLINKAVSNKKGKARLYLCETNTGDNRLYKSDKRKSILVDTIKLDDFFLKTKKLDISFIKMDIQGSEYLAVEGMSKIIQNSTKLKLITEFWPKGLARAGSNGEAYLKQLKHLGFKIYHFKEGSLKEVFNNKFGLMWKTEDGEEFTDLFCVKS